MGTLNKKSVRRLAEAARAVAKYSSEGLEVESVLLSGLAGELQDQLDLQGSAAFSTAECLTQVARERHALWFRHAL